MIHGTRPATVAKPKEGIWWVKIAEPRYVPSTVAHDQPCNDYRTWDGHTASWVLLEIHEEHGWVDSMGSDEGRDLWREQYTAPIALGPRVEPPEEA